MKKNIGRLFVEGIGLKFFLEFYFVFEFLIICIGSVLE